MIKVALTGNIGSGKSSVAKIFNIFGIPVFNADVEARSMYYYEEVKNKIQSVFTDSILSPTGEVDTKKLASIIFNDKKALQKVNAIIHPLVINKYYKWCNKHKHEYYTIHEAAIIFENNLQNNFDAIINVSAPSDIRIKRVMERDDISEELVKMRMTNQLSDEIKCELSHFIINNDGNNFLIPQVNNIHNSLLSNNIPL
jgi:dephospho-CoA kinase